MCCPSIQKGHVRIANLLSGKEEFVDAHESPLAFVALNQDGSRLATASEKGTIIRVYKTNTESSGLPTLLKEVRRGSHYAEIYSMCFSADSQYLVVSSGRGTIHIFALGMAEGPGASVAAAEGVEQNRKSTFGFLSSVSTYFSSEWSFAWFKGPDVPCICAFGPDDASIFVVASNGQFLKLAFQREGGGEMKCMQYEIFCSTLNF
eukprot:TRINITY_DN6086_c0_g1_i3.p1 TRINITY_DN6086_c0_g1~~TRINITY_DN6086_c0_g1_i3.p1  ORF type:complete len:205 (-),score=54.61 TRINITY_DN6086_c0_g1_i3:150-764(-)